jgi:3-dehydroquinate synthase
MKKVNMKNTEILELKLARRCKIFVGDSLISKIPQLIDSNSSKKGIIIFDQLLKTTANSLLKSLKNAGWAVDIIQVSAGEGLKDFKKIASVYDSLLGYKAKRDTILFVIGGGSVGDSIGFVASTYMRGVDWVNIPTTLLAQVDSSVGGKTAINHPSGKNLIGTFHQPLAVFCDVNTLASLPRRDVISGFGEAVKYGLVFDRKFFKSIQKRKHLILKQDKTVLKWLVLKSLKHKVDAVKADEFDQKGIREVLNFGHTFGHVVESVTGFRLFRHGEAVIIGMRFALTLSLIKKSLSQKEFEVADGFLKTIPVPDLPKISFNKIKEAMSMDKKFFKGKLRFVLLKKIGVAFSDSSVNEAELKSAYSLLLERLK